MADTVIEIVSKKFIEINSKEFFTNYWEQMVRHKLEEVKFFTARARR